MRARFAAVLFSLLSLVCFSGAQAGPFKVVHTFTCPSGTDCPKGSAPQQLVADAAGNLYGVTYYGGPYRGNGVVFELAGGSHFEILYTFCKRDRHHLVCPDGEIPRGPLILDTAGNLYGATASGGAYHAGTAFKLSPDAAHTAWTLTTLHDFCAPADPVCLQSGAGLSYAGQARGAFYDGVSPLYGVHGGSAFGPGYSGHVFALKPGAPWTLESVYAFCQQYVGGKCLDGSNPYATPVVDEAGNIFGSTQNGGNTGMGALYELQPPSAGMTAWTETVLHSFCSGGWPDCPDGAMPVDHLTPDAAGNLYGVTLLGGRQCRIDELAQWSCGVAYKLVPNGTSSVQTVLHTFCAKPNCTDGGQPDGGLAIDAGGKLYGTTSAGGGNPYWQAAGPGVLFSLDGSTYKILHRFCAEADCADGTGSSSAPMIAPDGVLYGQSSVIYRFRPH